MGSSASKTSVNRLPSKAAKDGKESTPEDSDSDTENEESSLRDKVINKYLKRGVDQSWIETDDPYLKSLLATLLESVQFFIGAAKEGSEWANKTGRKHATRLSTRYSTYRKVKVSPAKKSVIKDMLLGLDFPACLNTLFASAMQDLPDIFSKDESVLRSESKLKEKQQNDNSDSTKQKEDNLQQSSSLVDAQFNLSKVLALILNCTDAFPDFCLECGKEGLLKTLLKCITLFYSVLEEEDKQGLTASAIGLNSRTRILSYSLSILHNTGKVPENRKYFENNDGLNKVLPYLGCEIHFLSMKALIILAYLIDESNNHLILANQEPIKLLITFLNKASKNPRHRHMGFSVAELSQGLSLIAQNDDNKKSIGDSNGIGVLASVIQGMLDKEEELQCCKALWILSFDQENCKLILEDKQLINKLRSLKNSKNIDIQKAASGILWEIEGRQERKAEGQENSGGGTSSGGHIMISYQWDHQKTVVKIRDRLTAAGYKVWLDIDQMGGSTLEAMANAVEGATAIIVTVCRQYRDSPNCRSEAEYAFQLKRKIIPIMMEHEYKPDGWLGFIVGAKFWIDFKDHFALDNSLEKLVEEMKGCTNSSAGDAVQVVQVDGLGTTPSSQPPPTKKSVISSWDKNQVKEWLQELNLYSSIDNKACESLDGKVLGRLHSLRRESPEFFYSSIRQDLGLTSLFSVLSFVDELEKLFSE